MNKLVIFEGKNINIITGEGNEPLFELYGVGQALGYVKIAKGKEYVRKERVDKTIENADIEPVVHNGQQYLSEEMIYDFMFEAKTNKCKSFRKWLSKEVLPSIRKNGAYMEETITDMQQELLIKYATPSFRKNTFLNNTPVEMIWEAYVECMDYYSKKPAPDRIKIEKEIVAALKERKAIALNNGSPALALMVGEEIEKIQKKINERSNRSYGARLAHKNKKLNEAYVYIGQLEPDVEEYKCLNLHGFSVNSMYQPNITEYGIIRTDYNGKPLLTKTKAYKKWLDNFKTEMDKQKELNIDLSKDIDIFLYFNHKKKFDCSNFHKSFFDALANYYGVDDRKFHLKMCDTNYIIENYEEGKIFFCIRERAV